MKHVSLITLLLLINLSFVIGQNVNFYFDNGLQQSFAIEDIDKITFDQDVMNLHLASGSSFSWNVSTINYFQYDQLITSNENVDESNNNRISIYPNPSSSQVTIDYSVREEEHVIIEVYDVNGRLISQLLNGVQSYGEHRVIWDGKSSSGQRVGPGKYFCSVITSDGRLSEVIIFNR